ncbi:MAG: hypothetical protein L3J78_04355 [Thermoplasmata archaeon]|nr:hypothetical protein [Thermoplasmata archaeon]
MSRARLVALAFALTAAVALLLATTLAAAGDDDGVPEDIETATQRTVAAIASGDEFSVSSRLASGRVGDQFEVSYKAGTLAVRYGRDDGATSSYELVMENIVEWNDTNGNGRLDNGETVAWEPLGTSAFGGAPVVQVTRTGTDGGRVFEFHVRSNAGDLNLNVTIAERFRRVDTLVLTPMEALVDLGITHNVSHAGANVGIELRMNTEDQAHYADRSWDELHGFAPDESAINVTGGVDALAPSVFFSWANTARADGGAIPVNVTTSSSSATSSLLYVAYATNGAAAPAVTHHTTLGVESAAYADVLAKTPELRGDLVLYAASLVAMSALVAVTIVFANRRRKKRSG